MGLFSRLVDANSVPTHKKAVDISSPLTGKVIRLDDVPHAMFTERLFGEGVAIKPSGHQVLAPFSGTMLLFPELANQLRIKAKNGLQMQIQLGIDSHLMMGEGFKRVIKQGEHFEQGQVLAEFSIIKMKRQLSSILCPITLLNSDKIKGLQAHYYQVVAGEDKLMTVYI
ncbi:PTS glucose transporter subunit IIA [uncultured Paraglaciecola sp.]|jgi:sugar PTS system EIIA component|uniref:PTS sugar transporter subunit IIA n=1 Tax=uncultured Paraglaciecola sp. TaxID=1765024 RepID=UPI0025CCB3D4|nr:PTS glucose transporter subunit IIA [uncultured Paraglaciecola sp.]